MPENDYVWLPRESVLTFEEIGSLVGPLRRPRRRPRSADRRRAAAAARPAGAGRAAGGPPATARPRADDQRRAAGRGRRRTCARAGLHRITVSLDTLRSRPLRVADSVRRARGGARRHRACGRAGFASLEARHGRHARRQRRRAGADCSSTRRAVGAELRFIEYMDVGGATRWSPSAVVLARRRSWRGSRRTTVRLRRWTNESSAPADRFRLPDGLMFGIIASTTAPFCADCDRARLTADGDVAAVPLRAGRHRSPAAAAGRARCRGAQAPGVAPSGQSRADRGAEERLSAVRQRDL